jgi:type I restriction enzyme S subunit
MRSDWTTYKLSEIVLIIGGGTPKRSQKEYWEGGTIDWLSVKDFKGLTRYVEITSEKITEQGLSKSSTKILNSGDLIISARGTVGEIAQLKKPMAFNQSCYGIRALETHTINNYLYYLIKFHISSLRQNAHGGIFDTITTDTFKLIDVVLPPLAEQKRIAALLGSLDDLIENTRKMNEILEEMAQAIFKSWFIDFDGVPEEDLVESELGLIPRGWEVGDAYHYAKLNIENWTHSKHPDTVEYVDISNTNWGSIDKTTTYNWLNAPSRARRVLKKGDTIIGCVRPDNGAYSLIYQDGLTGSTGFAVLTPRKDCYKEFIYLASTQLDYIKYLGHLADGGAYPAIKPSVIMDQKLPIPPTDILNHFSLITGNLLQTVFKNREQIQTLSELRDTLLPKLISGELRIPEAEKIVEDIL